MLQARCGDEVRDVGAFLALFRAAGTVVVDINLFADGPYKSLKLGNAFTETLPGLGSLDLGS